MLLAQDVRTKTFKRTDREKTVAKRLPEATLCRLLGLSGLGWDDQALLAPVWLTLHQQSDKASREMVLRAFFQELGKKVPAFTQFWNSTLFDNIISHKFEPGAAYESCNHGISLLSVSMHSFAAQERERQDNDHFDQATNKTPEAVRKHSAKAPPPLPTTIAELQQLMWQLIVLTRGLFTTNCSLAIQLHDLFTAVQEREQTLMGDPAAVDELIPQLAWAVTAAAREFYGTISTRGDVDPPEDEYGPTAPTVAITQLSIHTTMFKAGYRLNLTNILDQWRRHPPNGTPANQQRRSDGNSNSNNRNGKGGGQEKRHGSNPFQAVDSTKPAVGKNPKPPMAFANLDITKLRNKISDVTLSDIVREAGLKGGPSNLNTGGLPTNCCLNWVCMGGCMRPRCTMTHPESIDETAATAVYQQIAPGVARLLETGKKPLRN
jgi:hypothetical protein